MKCELRGWSSVSISIKESLLQDWRKYRNPGSLEKQVALPNDSTLKTASLMYTPSAYSKEAVC